jgi:phosphatidate cytidylyltransferase
VFLLKTPARFLTMGVRRAGSSEKYTYDMFTRSHDARRNHPATKSTSDMNNLQKRWRTALIFGPLILLMVALGGWWFFAIAFTLTVIGTLEFCNLARNRALYPREIVALPANVGLLLLFMFGQTGWAWVIFAAAFLVAIVVSLLSRRTARQALRDALMTLASLIYVSLAGCLLLLVRAAPNGLIWLLLILFLTWGTDTFAYFGGRAWGKTLLAPRISPKKTVEGALVGIAGGFSVATLLLLATGHFTPALLPLLLAAPVVAVIGDLSESALKRAFDVKDSHLSHFNLFPGHGGVLDRTDALILVTWFCYAAYILLGIVVLS